MRSSIATRLHAPVVEAPGVAASILEVLDEMLTVNRLGLSTQLRRSLACTNLMENMMRPCVASADKAALAAHKAKHTTKQTVEEQRQAA